MDQDQDQYFIIRGSCDGTSCSQMTREQLLKNITPDKDGETYYGWREAEVLAELPDDISSFSGLVIIKGRIVVPTAKQTVTQYEIP